MGWGLRGFFCLPTLFISKTFAFGNWGKKMPSPNPGTLRLPRTFALSTADPRTARSATGAPLAPLSGHMSRCWGPAGTFSSLTPLFQKLCLRWTNQGTTENHSLAYRVTGIAIKSRLREPPPQMKKNEHKLALLSCHSDIMVPSPSSHVRSQGLVKKTAHTNSHYSPENSVRMTETGWRGKLGWHSHERKTNTVQETEQFQRDKWPKHSQT